VYKITLKTSLSILKDDLNNHYIENSILASYEIFQVSSFEDEQRVKKSRISQKGTNPLGQIRVPA
jgi:hypothetical protein